MLWHFIIILGMERHKMSDEIEFTTEPEVSETPEVEEIQYKTKKWPIALGVFLGVILGSVLTVTISLLLVHYKTNDNSFYSPFLCNLYFKTGKSLQQN